MRKLTIKDKEWIEKIARVHEYYLEQREINYHATRMSMALRQEMILRRLSYSEDVILIEDDGLSQLIAFIWGHYNRDFETVIIEMLYTDPYFRGKGYAKQLKSSIEQWAVKQGALSIEGTIDAHHTHLIEMNQVRGYEVSHVKMRKDLR